MFPMFSSMHGLISPTPSFSALSHSSPKSSSPLQSPPPLLYHKSATQSVPGQFSAVEMWKCVSDAACCHGHHTLDMTVTRTVRLSQGLANTSINF